MATQYGTVLTAAGKALVNMAIANGQPIRLTGAGLGSGLWLDNEQRETLKNERAVIGVQQISAGQNPLAPIVRVLIPANIGGWTLNELALYTAEGAVFAITRYPSTHIPEPGTQPVSANLEIDLVLPVGEADVIHPVLEPGLIATREWAEAQLLASKAASDNAYAPAQHRHPWSAIDDKPTAFPPTDVDGDSVAITVKRLTAAELNTVTPALGELVLVTDSESDDHILYVGDGKTAGGLDVLSALAARVLSLESLVSSDDLDLDTLQEVIAYIKQNRELLESAQPDWSVIQNKPATYPPSAHAHSWASITEKPSTFTPANHDHTYTSLGGANFS